MSNNTRDIKKQTFSFVRADVVVDLFDFGLSASKVETAKDSKGCKLLTDCHTCCSCEAGNDLTQCVNTYGVSGVEGISNFDTRMLVAALGDEAPAVAARASAIFASSPINGSNDPETRDVLSPFDNTDGPIPATIGTVFLWEAIEQLWELNEKHPEVIETWGDGTISITTRVLTSFLADVPGLVTVSE